MNSIHDCPAVEAWRRAQRVEPLALRKFRDGYYRKGQNVATALEALPVAARAEARGRFRFHTLELASRHDSRVDGASKLVFRTVPGLQLETVVLRLASGRTTLCLSTQVGCAARCVFCATGQIGMVRNLSRDEILDQVVQANGLLAAEGRRARNLVFMGMGEPLHNEVALYAALDVLCDPRAFAYHPQRLLVSTVGIPDAMRRLAARYPEVRLALSLHSVRPAVREHLMPIATRHDLAALRAALFEIGQPDQPVMVEYLLLKDLTDTDADIAALASYLSGLSVHLNLIPFNPIGGAARFEPSDRDRQARISAALKAAGLRVTTRYSLGADIAAACGQLVRPNNQPRGQAKGNAAANGLPSGS